MKHLTTYGMSSFESVMSDKRYYVDKTMYIEKLEQVKYPIFLRPRRFGKSLFTETLRWYYDIKAAHRFDELFGNLYIGKKPTQRKNSYFFLKLDFSGMGNWIEGDKNSIRNLFNQKIATSLTFFLFHYADLLKLDDNFINNLSINYKDNATGALEFAIGQVNKVSGKMFIAIDEYDSLTNAMALYYKDADESENEYLNILKKNGFFRAFFETIKAGTASAVDQVYITGILPITIADMNSGFNIATWITFDRRFSSMLGITHNEFEQLIDSITNDYNISHNKESIQNISKRYYNGYKFHEKGELVYNPMMSMYLLDNLMHFDELPENLIDNNLRIDFNQLSYIFGNNTEHRNKIIKALTENKEYEFNSDLRVSFDMNAYREGKFITEGLYYSGILTFSDNSSYLKIPNLVTYEFMLTYFNRIMDFNTSGILLTKIVSEYIRFADVNTLIKNFFQLVIQKYPGDFFKNVNESFYHGLLFYILWNTMPKDCYEVLTEYQVTTGQVDIMVRSLPGARVAAQLQDLFELKRVAKHAKEAEFAAQFHSAKDEMKLYKTGDFAQWRGVAVCFRGNKDFRMEVS